MLIYFQSRVDLKSMQVESACNMDKQSLLIWDLFPSLTAYKYSIQIQKFWWRLNMYNITVT